MTQVAGLADRLNSVPGDICQQYEAFEPHHGFDGDHAVCKLGAVIKDAMQRARTDKGWDEFKSG